MEELRHLPQRPVQRVRQIHRFRQSLRNRIQHHQLTVAPPDFLLRPFALRDVQQKTLIRRDVPVRVAHRHGRFQHRPYFPVPPSHLELEIRHTPVFVQQSLQPLAVRRIHEKLRGNIRGQQFLARIVSGHAHQRVVKIQKPPVWRRNKHAFLHARNQRPVLLLRALPLRDVLQHMHDAHLPAGAVRQVRIGRQKISRQPWVRTVALARHSFAVRTHFVPGPFRRQQVPHAPPDQRRPFASQQLVQPVIRPHHTPLRVVHQYRIPDRVERIRPLLLRRRHLFKQAHVLQRQSDQIRQVHQIRQFIRLEPHRARQTDAD